MKGFPNMGKCCNGCNILSRDVRVVVTYNSVRNKTFTLLTLIVDENKGKVTDV